MDLSIPADWFVNPQVLSEFYERFKERPQEEIRKFSYEQGLALGRVLIKQLGVKGGDESAMITVLKAALRDEPTATVTKTGEGKVLLRNAGFCPLMTACLSMNLPWTWICSVLGWPFFHGLVSAVNPKVDLSMIKRRAKGDPYCDHLFEIGEGRLILP